MNGSTASAAAYCLTSRALAARKGRKWERATPGNGLEADPSLAHVEDKIEARLETVEGFGYLHRQIAAK